MRKLNSLVITKDTELPITVQLYYKELKKKYGVYGARITDIIQMLEVLQGNQKFELFDANTWNSGQFSSYLMDQQIKFMAGEELDMVIFHDDILKVYQWTKEEKKRFDDEIIEEKIWAIFKFVIDPSLVFDNIL